MKDAGIFDGDRVIIDRAVEPRDGSIVVAWWNSKSFSTVRNLSIQRRTLSSLRSATTPSWEARAIRSLLMCTSSQHP